MSKPIDTSVPDLEKIGKALKPAEGGKRVQGDMGDLSGVNGWDFADVDSTLLDAAKELS
jgi:hypothetical protein